MGTRVDPRPRAPRRSTERRPTFPSSPSLSNCPRAERPPRRRRQAPDPETTRAHAGADVLSSSPRSTPPREVRFHVRCPQLRGAPSNEPFGNVGRTERCTNRLAWAEPACRRVNAAPPYGTPPEAFGPGLPTRRARSSFAAWAGHQSRPPSHPSSVAAFRRSRSGRPRSRFRGRRVRLAPDRRPCTKHLRASVTPAPRPPSG
jgi:hypothetical protein